MRAFADQISEGLQRRGFSVTEMTAPVLFGRLLPRSSFFSKWLGYIDQFLIFPPFLFIWTTWIPNGTLCILTDQALGPWLPWISNRAHVVHCHDLLALEASLGRQPFHGLSRSGRLYQRWILRGFRKGRCFLSVSAASKAALERFLPQKPLLSAVVYNPVPVRFSRLPNEQTESVVRCALPDIDQRPFLFHIGRNWYKNRLGVLKIWEQLHLNGQPIDLVLVGALDSPMQSWLYERPKLITWLHVLASADDELVVSLYNRAEALLYPSHAEGFGWPVLEALACGCAVVTTDRPPMTEVGGDAVYTIAPAPPPPASLDVWSRCAAQQLQQVLSRNLQEKERIRELGFAQARCFEMEAWLDQLIERYEQAFELQVKIR